VSRRPDVHPGPRVRWAELKAKTSDSEDASFLSSAYGLIPDDWQIPILDDWLSRRPDGKWCYGRCGLAVPRQNGKNGVIEVRELFGMVVLGEAILHTAHEVKTARKAFKRLQHFFGKKANDPDARYPDLNALVAEVRNTNGQEAIFLKDIYDEDGQFVRRGGSVEIVARSSGSGRGFTVDLLVLDEAQNLADDELEAIRSAVSSAPLGNPQVIYTGTPPNREKGELGVVWLRVRKGSGKDKRLTWTEYGVADGPMPDIDDIDLLFEVNPALELRHGNGAYGLTMDVVRDERGDLSPEGYARERYGWWGNPETVRRGVIDMDRFRTLRVDAPAPTIGQIVVDVAPDLLYTSIAVATGGNYDPLDPRIVLPLHRTLVLVDRLDGTETAAAAVKHLVDGLDRVVEVALTPTAKLISPALTKLRIEHETLTNSQVGQGCVAYQEMVRNGTTAHVGQQELNDAARNSVTRYVGDTQHWDRRERSIDISSLVAGSVAAQRWVANTAVPDTPPPPPRRARKSTGRAIDRVGF
jgi:hypothetical protein